MKQYAELKAQAGDALLLFRMGDFYELFADDAIEAAKILEITLTSRDKNKPNPMPMAGVPYHSVQGYLTKLLKAGKKVAISEQIIDPDSEAKIVRREIVRTLTPGVQFDLEGSESQYLAALCSCMKDGKASPHFSTTETPLFVLACVESSTGEILLGRPGTAEQVFQEAGHLSIKHLLFREIGKTPEHSVENVIRPNLSRFDGVLVEKLPAHDLTAGRAAEILKFQFGLSNLDVFFPTEAAAISAASLVNYLCKTQKRERLEHLRLPTAIHQPKSLTLSSQSIRHLDLLPDSEPQLNLFNLIQFTRSALGSRKLRSWLLSPLKNVPAIHDRQKAVKSLIDLNSSEPVKAQGLGKELSEVYDLERILGRVNTGLANPRDTFALGRSLARISSLPALLPENSVQNSRLLQELSEDLVRLNQKLHPLQSAIIDTQNEEAPLVVRDGGIFKKGASPELDRLLDLSQDGQNWLVALETRERTESGISSLKVRYNRVFGYYIEITSAHLKNVPSHYQRKQTMVGGERFFTEELKKFEEDFLTASTRQKALEQEMFTALLGKIQAETAYIMELASKVASLDAILSLSRLESAYGWVLPEINESLDLDIEAGRHPLVDSTSRGRFVPNSLHLGPSTRTTLLVTGPNMGGKSTVMRQTALIVLLGQMGAPVPAQSARWGVFHSLYTRIGAHDAIAKGQSTFMVEMSELAQILHEADDRSLIILDEIGRGTSTYDGMSVAWATLEWICSRIKARTLFATHYHELTRLAGQLPLLANAHMAVESKGQAGTAELRFLYELREGPASESFGVHVARLAGLPAPVVARAWEVLEELEKTSPQTLPVGAVSLETSIKAAQLSLFGEGADDEASQESKRPQLKTIAEIMPPLPEVQELRAANLNEFTPIQALNFLAKLQEISRESEAKSS
jgi:DNA mismatch repair protein MutS